MVYAPVIHDPLYATLGEPHLLAWLALHLPEGTREKIQVMSVEADAGRLRCRLVLHLRDQRQVELPIEDDTVMLDEEEMLKVMMLV
jgi:hypothetical protein